MYRFRTKLSNVLIYCKLIKSTALYDVKAESNFPIIMAKALSELLGINVSSAI